MTTDLKSLKQLATRDLPLDKGLKLLQTVVLPQDIQNIILKDVVLNGNEVQIKAVQEFLQDLNTNFLFQAVSVGLEPDRIKWLVGVTNVKDLFETYLLPQLSPSLRNFILAEFYRRDFHFNYQGVKAVMANNLLTLQFLYLVSLNELEITSLIYELNSNPGRTDTIKYLAGKIDSNRIDMDLFLDAMQIRSKNLKQRVMYFDDLISYLADGTFPSLSLDSLKTYLKSNDVLLYNLVQMTLPTAGFGVSLALNSVPAVVTAGSDFEASPRGLIRPNNGGSTIFGAR